MARTYALTAKLQFTLVFDVDAAVGKGAPNRREDVMLVQYLLAVWMSQEKDPKFGQMLIGKPLPMKIDGVYGPQTQTIIHFFDDFFQSQVKRDGRVDPLFQGQQGGKLWLLNQILFFAGGLRGGIPDTRIPFPAQLRGPLFRP